MLRNAGGGGGYQLFWKKALRRCNLISVHEKKHYITLEWPLIKKYDEEKYNDSNRDR